MLDTHDKVYSSIYPLIYIYIYIYIYTYIHTYIQNDSWINSFEYDIKLFGYRR